MKIPTGLDLVPGICLQWHHLHLDMPSHAKLYVNVHHMTCQWLACYSSTKCTDARFKFHSSCYQHLLDFFRLLYELEAKQTRVVQGQIHSLHTGSIRRQSQEEYRYKVMPWVIMQAISMLSSKHQMPQRIWCYVECNYHVAEASSVLHSGYRAVKPS